MDERISADKVMKFGLRGYKDFVDFNWHGLPIKIRPLITREEEYDAVRSIVECCMYEGEEEGSCFVPENLELSIRANIVIYYTNVLLPSDIDEQHKLLFYSNLYDVVLEHASKSQIEAIINSVYRRV